MSNVAVGEDGKLYYADDFNGEYGGNFSCPEKDCGCKLIFKNVGGSKMTYKRSSPYFSAIPSNPHAKSCQLQRTSISDNKLKESNFTTQGFFDNILSGKSEQINENKDHGQTEANQTLFGITTTNQLWRYCSQHKDDHILPDGVMVKEIFQEKRNSGFYGRKNQRIILLGYKNCNYKRGQIWCYFPHDENQVPPANYYFLEFENATLGFNLMLHFCKILEEIKRQKSYAHFVVAGEWIKNHCVIKNKKQIFILSK